MPDLLSRMRNNPAADWTVSDVARVCAQHGVRCVPPSGGGSHYKVSHPSQRTILKRIAAEMQLQAFQDVPHIPLG